MKKPTNTTQQAKDDPMSALADAMVFSASGSIERQEKVGQGELVNSDVLPTDGIEDVRKMIGDNGGEVKDKVDDDPIFTEVVLPEGWKKKPSDHSMWSYLHDDQDRCRAAFFYKAASYDRSAHIRAQRRFEIDLYGHDVEGEVCVRLKDACGEVEFPSPVVQVSKDDKYEVIDRLESKVKAFLDENYPDWKSADAYWNDLTSDTESPE